MNFQLKRVIYSVGDVEKTADFYKEAFGFSATTDPDYLPSQWLEVVTENCNIGLFKEEQGNRVVRVVYFIDDIVAARRYLNDRGAEMEEIEDRGQFQICNGVDPAGILFQLSNRATT